MVAFVGQIDFHIIDCDDRSDVLFLFFFFFVASTGDRWNFK